MYTLTDTQIIGIIVPVYNVKEYLDRCIKSILAQTLTDFKLVLVDDGSNDGSAEICDKYGQIDQRVIVYHQQNAGQSKARNVGLDYTFSNDNIKYITFVDSDDVISPKYLEVLYNALIAEQSDMCIAESKTLREGELFEDQIDNNIESSEDLESFWLKYNSPIVWGKLYKKFIFNEIRYPQGVIFEDEATTYKIVFKCKKITHCNSVIYGYYRYRLNSTMNQKATPQRQEMWLNAFKQQLDFYYKNHYEKLFDLYFRFYTNFIQQTVIDFWKNKEFETFFKKIILQYRNFPIEYPEYFQTKTLKCEYKRIFKHYRRFRKRIICEDYLSIKQEKGFLFAILFKIKHYLPIIFLLNNRKVIK